MISYRAKVPGDSAAKAATRPRFGTFAEAAEFITIGARAKWPGFIKAMVEETDLVRTHVIEGGIGYRLGSDEPLN